MASSCKWCRTTVTVPCIVLAALAIVSCLFYNPHEEINNIEENVTTSSASHAINTNVARKVNKTKPLFNPAFPRCYSQSIHTILAEIIQELQSKKTTCTDRECQYNINEKDPAKTGIGSRGVIVVYAAVTLLLISLVAAFLEVWKARKTPVQTKSKPELSRRCSLADLTVLRHNRRESLMRRDSAFGMTGETPHRISLKQLGRKMSRPRLRVN